ncbi:calphotin-like [Cydia strobilella]|uniref:calphotin-like n=1 Tax=Cydia strobilella TaxID=1100964 RepID=UPI0030079B35
MKYLLAFALVAVAAALPEPVRLPQPALPEVAPLLIPQPVASPLKFVDAPKAAAPVEAVKVVDAPVEAVPADFTLNFVDVAPEIAEAPVDNFAVKIVDNADVDVAAEIADAPVENLAVKIVDNADVDVAADIAKAPVENLAVKIVDIADVDEETPSHIPIDTPFQIKIVDMPLPDSVAMPLLEPVKIADAPIESNDFAVKFVDVAPEVPVNMLPKGYPDPMWR